MADERVATTEPGEVAKPDYVKGNRGFEQMEAKDMVLARLSLCQSMTPQRQESDPKFIDGLKEGHLFNSLTGKIYGKHTRVVPLFFFKSRIFFKDINEGGGIICQAPDGKSCQLNHGGPCLHQAWGASGEPPECNEFFNYPCIMLDDKGVVIEPLIVVSLKATGLKAGKEWNALMRMRGADMFSGIYNVDSQPARNKAGQTYQTYKVTNSEPRWVEPALYQQAEKMFQQVSEGIAAGSITVDESTASDDAFASRDAEEM